MKKLGQYSTTILCALMVAGATVLSKGDPYVAISVAILFGLGCLTFYYEQYSFYALVFLVLILEQFPISRPFDNTITVVLGRYYLGNLYKVIPLDYLKMNALELHLVLLGLVLVYKLIFDKNYSYPKMTVLPLALLFWLFVCMAEVRGIGSGGDFLTSLWEIRALAYVVAVIIMMPMLVRTRSEVRALVWTILLALTFKAFQGIFYFFYTLGGKLTNVQTILAHEDSHFFNFAFILLLGLILFKVRDTQRRLLFFVLPAMGFMFLVNQRRVTYGTLALGVLIALIVVDNPAVKRRALGFAGAFLLLLVPYTAIFWNSASFIALPIRQAKSVFDTNDTSNLYRVNEKVNLAYSITSSPLGEGFGRRYRVIVPMDDISDSFPLWDFIPHNSVLGFWTKAGTHGFIIFMFFFCGVLAEATNAFRRLRDPYYKVLALVTMTQIVGQLIVSYYDLQLNYYRNMVFLGALVGLMAALRRLDAAEQSASVQVVTVTAQAEQLIPLEEPVYV